MKVTINETCETIALSIIDPKSGQDYISDFIGNTGALSDGQFVRNEDSGDWSCSQETAAWWSKVIDDNQALNYRIAVLVSVHGEDAVHEIVAYAGSDDLEMHAALINTALDEAYPDDL